MRKPKQPNKKEENLRPLVKSDVIRRLIELLEEVNPVHLGLRPEATLEQRALKQVEIQTFHFIMAHIKFWYNGEKRAEIESTYEADKTK